MKAFMTDGPIFVKVSFVTRNGAESEPMLLADWEMTRGITERETGGLIERVQSGTVTIAGQLVENR